MNNQKTNRAVVGDVNWAVFWTANGAVHGAVYWDVYRTAGRAVSEAVSGAVTNFTFAAVYQSLKDSDHSALQGFLQEAST